MQAAAAEPAAHTHFSLVSPLPPHAAESRVARPAALLLLLLRGEQRKKRAWETFLLDG